MVFDSTNTGIIKNSKQSYAIPIKSKKRSKSKRRYIKREIPKINERRSSLYLPITAQATVNLPISTSTPTYTQTYYSNYNNILSLNSPTYISNDLQPQQQDQDQIEEIEEIEYTAGSELNRPFSTCSTYSNNSLGLDFFPSPPDHINHFNNIEGEDKKDEEEEEGYSSSIYCNFDHSSDLDLDLQSRFPETDTGTETENTTYVSTPTTSYDFDQSNIELDINKWKNRSRLVSFSTTNLHSHNNNNSHSHTYTQTSTQTHYNYNNSPYPCLFSSSDPNSHLHGIGTGTGNIHHQQAYSPQQKRHSFYDTKTNYSNWAKEKFYASEIDLITLDYNYSSTPSTPLQIINTTLPQTTSTPTNRQKQRQRNRQIETPKQNKTHKRKLSKTFVNIIDRMTVALENRKKDSIGSGLINRKDSTDIWSNDNKSTDKMNAPPPIPARSRLRSVPSTKLLAADPNIPSPVYVDDPSASSTELTSGPSTMKVITHRQSSLFRLPVDPLPIDNTPSTPTSKSPSKLAQSPASPGANEGTTLFGRRKASRVIERDPMKVKDGLQAKESTSGVYTPQTFPGAQGPRPSHFPTHVYTPTNFALYPQASPISPSASSVHSSSSSQSDSTAPPKTPLSPTNRISQVVSSNMRRFSSGLVSLKDKTYPGTTSSTGHQRSITTPMLESGEYLSNSNAFESKHSRESSWASWSNSPSTQNQPRLQPKITLQHSNSGYFPPLVNNGAGLGVGLEEESNNRMEGERGRIYINDDTVIIEASMDPINFSAPKSSNILGQGSGSLVGKGKRKPVPRLGGEESPVHAM